jgi:hypothetical protein
MPQGHRCTLQSLTINWCSVAHCRLSVCCHCAALGHTTALSAAKVTATCQSAVTVLHLATPLHCLQLSSQFVKQAGCCQSGLFGVVTCCWWGGTRDIVVRLPGGAHTAFLQNVNPPFWTHSNLFSAYRGSGGEGGHSVKRLELPIQGQG